MLLKGLVEHEQPSKPATVDSPEQMTSSSDGSKKRTTSSSKAEETKQVNSGARGEIRKKLYNVIGLSYDFLQTRRGYCDISLTRRFSIATRETLERRSCPDKFRKLLGLIRLSIETLRYSEAAVAGVVKKSY